MKIFGLVLVSSINNDTKVIKYALDLSSFGYFTRYSVKDFFLFFSQEIINRTKVNERQSVKEQDYLCNAYLSSRGIGAVMICDDEYSQHMRVAYSLLNKLVDQYLQLFPNSSQWNIDNQFPIIDEYLKKYQNPREADTLLKIQSDLDETKIIMHKNIEAMLERGQKLDDIVIKTQHLSDMSKQFYKVCQKTNQCNCIIL